MQTYLFVFGTRPEAIKMAPVIREMKKCDRARIVVCVTAQHRQMLDQVLELFRITADYDLNLMREQQTLTSLTASTLVALEPVLAEVRPDWVLVQGDTTTAMAASLLAFYHHIKVGHIEAGLRTRNKHAPFPEEINRRITGVVSDAHFAPTEQARQALRSEGIAEESIHVTGNTIVDALLWVRDQAASYALVLPTALREELAHRRVILVTGHRRESFGGGIEQICLALRDLAQMHPDIAIVYPVHLNPRVRDPVNRILGGVKGVYLIEPLPYASFVWFMNQAYLILTDSGGVQEEGPSLGKPVLVMRETTERGEGIRSGNACLVGVEREAIVTQVCDLLVNKERYLGMTRVANPYGDGHAAERIAKLLLQLEEKRNVEQHVISNEVESIRR